MINYKRLYTNLFRNITQIIFDYENEPSHIIERLKQAQTEAEELYLSLCEEAFPHGEDLGHDFDEEEFDDELPEK